MIHAIVVRPMLPIRVTVCVFGSRTGRPLLLLLFSLTLLLLLLLLLLDVLLLLAPPTLLLLLLSVLFAAGVVGVEADDALIAMLVFLAVFAFVFLLGVSLPIRSFS